MATASTTKRSTLLKTAFSRSALVGRFLNTARETKTFEIAGLAGSASAFLVAHLHEQLNQTLVVVAPTEKEVRDFAGDLNEVLGDDKILSFPAWGIHPYAWLAPPLENISERLETLCRLISGGVDRYRHLARGASPKDQSERPSGKALLQLGRWRRI